MTTRQKIEDKGVNINTLVGLVTLAAMGITAVFFIEPLRTLPDDVHTMKREVQTMSETQAVQTEALKTLADVAKDGREMRRDVDRLDGSMRAHDVQLGEVKRRLDKLEQ
jgi:hypothetical protein